MNKLLTEQTTLTTNLQIWAIPHSQWHMENYPDDGYFRFEVLTSEPYGENNILCNEQEVTIELPEGIDLGTKAVETMQAEIGKLRRQAKEAIEVLQERINAMQQLTHMIEIEAIEGEATPAYVDQD
jgi:hypothetical protein